MPRRLALATLAAAGPALLAAQLVPGRAASVVLAAVASALPVAFMALGAARGGKLGPVGPPLAALFVLVAGALGALLALAGRSAEAAWWSGLPLAAWIQLGVLFLGPLPLVGLAYALTHDRWTAPSEDDLRLLQELRAAGLRGGAEDVDSADGAESAGAGGE
jgi:hypothetical protein